MTKKFPRFMYNLHHGIILDDGKELMPHEAMELLNSFNEENEQLKIDIGILKDNHEIDREIIDDLHEYVKKLEKENEMLKFENEKYRNMFFEIVETALTDKNCRELYCKGILDIFDKANSLNQAREMIKEHLK